MSPRVTSDLLLVGSLPAASTETALRSAARLFGDKVFALPDGETARRSGWVGYERSELFEPHPRIRVVQRPSCPDGVARHVYDVSTFELAAGAGDLRFDRWPRIDEAIESYRCFRSLRDAGAIPTGARFQVGLPSPASVIASSFRSHFTADYPVVEQAYEDLVRRELTRLTREIPTNDLAVQWDICYEVLDLEGVLAWTEGDAWQRFIGPVRRLGELLPEEVLVGYHLCYGTLPTWPMYEARDMTLLVRMANAIADSVTRPVDWFHMAGPRHLRSCDENFFRPLRQLDIADARIYLGIVLPIDGAAGLRRRAHTARRHLPHFGIAMYCGFGRQPGQDGETTMRDHSNTVRSLGGWGGAD